jgi:hypothetical protein
MLINVDNQKYMLISLLIAVDLSLVDVDSDVDVDVFDVD